MTASQRTIEDIAERAQRLAAVNSAEGRSRREINRVLRSATRISGSGEEIGGTAFTILKRRQPPIAMLIEKNRIGGEELRAAEDITKAFFAISGALMIKPISMEKIDKSHVRTEPAGTIDAISRYQAWAKYWSKLAKRGNKTLEVVIAAVIDERPLRVIERDLQLRNGAASTMIARGLRDYAARANPPWVDSRLASRWIADAVRG